MSKLGLYIHIPFCKSKCKYCDFYSFPCYEREEAYINRLIEEIEFYSDGFKGVGVDTVYFGGGTPTSLKRGSLLRIFDELSQSFCIDNDAEITVEANPDTIDEDKVSELLRFATRVSVGVQSMDDEVLRFAGRIHDSNSAIRALDLLSGKFNLSADLMLGLPCSSIKKAVDSAKKILDKGINHLSCYGLKVEENTPFAKIDKSKFADDDAIADEYDAVREVCKSFGLSMYEVSNFAKPGFECRHNMRYWQRENYLGLGVSAHSFVDGVRFFNPSDIDGYIKTDFDKFTKIEEKLDTKSAIDETVMLALRTKKGIDTDKFFKSFGIDFFAEYKAKLNQLSAYLDIQEDRISIKDKYFYAMNSIIVEFLN